MSDQPGRPGTEAAAQNLGDFRRVSAWVFDLDNTLYPRHTNIYAQVDGRIHDYVRRTLGLPFDEAQRLQKDYYRRYGTTLRGLMIEHGITPDDFLEYVHDIDHTPVEPNPALGDAIERLPGRKFILTNGSRRHAEKVAERLGITRHFEDIFDIVWSELMPKPHRETYDRFLVATGVKPAEAAMFEDLSRNLEVPHALGMATVLVVPEGTRTVLTEEWELEGRDAPWVEHVTDDLGAFLGSVVDSIEAKSA
jgi:putative hydrolase of the HAD superfamily